MSGIEHHIGAAADAAVQHIEDALIIGLCIAYVIASVNQSFSHKRFLSLFILVDGIHHVSDSRSLMYVLAE